MTNDPEPEPATVTMLSRGKGVPDDARAAYKDIHAQLETQREAAAVTDLRVQRIGLEGEARLCADFRSERDARAALDDIRKRTEGVELLDVAIAPCPSPKDPEP